MIVSRFVDPRQCFTNAADAYGRYRPDYPVALVDWVLADAKLRPGDRLLDLGCGTGIASRQFARRGLSVIGVDPNAAMLAAARKVKGTVGYVRGEAEALPLAERSARAAIAGQAFHWFDLDRAVPEIGRVLVPGSTCFAFWNLRAVDTPFLRAYDQLIRQWCRGYPAASAEETIAGLLAHPNVTRERQNGFVQVQHLDRMGLLGRAWSSSYVVHGVDDAAGFNAELERLFDVYAKDDRIDFRYRTIALAFVPNRENVR